MFVADFSTGDLSEFGGQSDNMLEGSIQVVSDIVRPGNRRAGKATIHPENVFNEQQLRSQLNGPKISVTEGDETFMSFHMYMEDAPVERDNFIYWEGEPPPGSWNNVMTWWVEPSSDGVSLSRVVTLLQ